MDRFAHPVLEAAYAHWHRHRVDGGLPDRRVADPFALKHILPHILLADVRRDPLDFHYRLIGTYIDRFVRESYTGRSARQIEGKGPGSAIWESFRSVAETGRPSFRRFAYVGAEPHLVASHEVALPVGANGRDVDMLFCALVFAADRSGRDFPERSFVIEAPHSLEADMPARLARSRAQ